MATVYLFFLKRKVECEATCAGEDECETDDHEEYVCGAIERKGVVCIMSDEQRLDA